MKTPKPVVLFALANDAQKSLRLEEEESAARTALATAHDQSRIEYHNLGMTTLDDIYRNFNRFHNRIAIFHYCGHSDAEFLELSDQKARAAGLSTLMGMQKNLQLVFLNGCGNKQQLDELFDKGVKAVIATSAPIEDQKAQDFSKQFYEALAAGKSIRDAFDTAASFLKHQAPDLEVTTRGIKLMKEEEDFPWGLYAHPDQETVDLDWTLPEPPEPEDGSTTEKVELPWQDLELNRELVELTFTGMAEFDPGQFEKDLEAYDEDPSGARLNHLQNVMLEAFPSILSIQIRDLFSPPGKSEGRLRLHEINEVYLSLIRLLATISLSDLWNAVLDHQDQSAGQALVLRPEYLQDVKQFLELSSDQQAADFDYFWLFGSIIRIFNENELSPYVEELADLPKLMQTNSKYYDAYRFMEQLRIRLAAQNILTDEVETLCLEAEHHLGRILQKCAFLCTYQLVTVKEIAVSLPRRASEPVFLHNKSILKGYDYINMDQSLLKRNSSVNNNSIYLAREIEHEQTPLNMTPFLIDENAFKVKKDQLPKIHFLDYQEQGALHYRHAATLKDSFVVKNAFEDLQEKREYRRKYKEIELLFQLIDFFKTDLKLN